MVLSDNNSSVMKNNVYLVHVSSQGSSVFMFNYIDILNNKHYNIILINELCMMFPQLSPACLLSPPLLSGHMTEQFSSLPQTFSLSVSPDSGSLRSRTGLQSNGRWKQ